MGYNRREDPYLKTALDQNTHPIALASLAQDTKLNKVVLCAVAANKSTPPEALSHLAQHHDPAIRRHCALNPNLPEQSQKLLAVDPDDTVRHRIKIAFPGKH